MIQNLGDFWSNINYHFVQAFTDLKTSIYFEVYRIVKLVHVLNVFLVSLINEKCILYIPVTIFQLYLSTLSLKPYV